MPTPQNGQTHSNNLSTFAVSVWSNVFLFVKVCIFWKCMQYTIHWDKTHMLKKFPLYKINDTKMPSFFFWKLQLISFTFNLWSLYELKYKVLVYKTVCKIFHFRFRIFCIKVYIFVQQNAWILWLWNIIIPFKIKITEKLHTVFPKDLIFKLQQEFLKNNDILVSWSSPKPTWWQVF